MGDTHLLPMAVVQKLVEVGIPQDSVIFYQNDRWVFQVGQVISNNNQLNCPPFDSLGPFGKHLITYVKL